MHIRRIAGHEIALIEHDGAGPPVLFLHGSGLSARIWAPWFDRLADRRCVAPDLLGYGHSERLASPLEKDWREDLAVARELVEASPEPVDIVGHSYGGFLALQLALTAPRPIRRLALHEPVLWGALRSGGTDASQAAFQSVIDQLQRDPAGSPAWLEGFVDFWGGSGTWASMPRAHQRGWRVRGPLIAAEVIALTHEATPHTAYASVHAPTLVTMGVETSSFEQEVCALVVDQLPDGRLVSLAGGHNAVMTHADQVATHHVNHLAGPHSTG